MSGPVSAGSCSARIVLPISWTRCWRESAIGVGTGFRVLAFSANVTAFWEEGRKKNAMQIEVLDARTLSEADAEVIAELLARVWPNPQKPVAVRKQQMLDLAGDYVGPDDLAPRSFVIREQGAAIAHSAILPRVIGTAAGEMMIAGLTRVCTSPEQRGRGLGEIVVRAVFELVDEGAFSYALFQTNHQVRRFYENLGSRVVENRIVNSLGDPKQGSPFWDKVVLRYPGKGLWPEGEIDLRGPGY